MWKIAIGFVIFAALVLWMLSKAGDIDIGGEKHGEPAHTAPAATPPAIPASKP